MQICYRLSRRIRVAPHAFARFPLRRANVSIQRCYSFQTVHTTADTGHETLRSLLKRPPKILKPQSQNLKDPQAWISLLDPVLPPKLRSERYQDDAANAQNAHLTAEEVSGIIAQARYQGSKIDILLSLGEQGRWKAVVWLVTYMVDKLWTGNPQDRVYTASGPWSGIGNLQDHLDRELPLSTSLAKPTATTSINLDRLLDNEHPLGEGQGRQFTAGHEALGQIWQSLGNMIIKDATESTSIRLEILEILALLHNRGIMPESIYKYTPAQEHTAMRQPPTLHLLSSRILTSLSDAAWRAHEKRIVDEAREIGRSDSIIRPEIPGSVYRVRVGGLRHEVWLELILWACLQGGWLPYGASVLEATMESPKPYGWQALSWRELIHPPVKAGQERSINWEEVGYMVDTGGYADSPDTVQQQAKVARTVSSEVVTAYLDGLISLVQIGVGRRGTASNFVVEYATKIKNFLLGRCSLGLEATSWDAIVQRIIESQTVNIADSPNLASKIIALSSSYGEEIHTKNSPTREEQWQPLAPYLVDGTAAILGVAHRIILANIRRGDLKAALQSFEYLQVKVDRNKRIALEEFFRTGKTERRPQKFNKIDKIDFSGPQSRPDYPTFFTQVPATTLAQLLDLVTDAGLVDFGKWLLYSNEPDGPTIHRGYYTNPVIAPALIRFATASRDRDLLESILQAIKLSAYKRDRHLAAPLLLSIMDSQLQLGEYSRAAVTLKSFSLHPLLTRGHVHNLVALMTRARLTAEYLPQLERSPDSRRQDLDQTRILFRRVAAGGIDTHPMLRQAVRDMLMVAACINEQWATLCVRYLPQGFVTSRPSSQACTNMIQAVARTLGAEAGKRLVQTIWAPAREGNDQKYAVQSPEEGVNPMASERPSALAYQSPHTTRVQLALSTSSQSAQRSEIHAVITYKPNFAAMRAILVQADTELSMPSTSDAQDRKQARLSDPTVQWCLRMMQILGREVKDIDKEIDITADQRFEIEEDDKVDEARNDYSRANGT